MRVRADSRSVAKLIRVVRSSPPSCVASRRYALRLAMQRVERIRRRLRALGSLGIKLPHRERWLDVRDAELAGLSDNIG